MWRSPHLLAIIVIAGCMVSGTAAVGMNQQGGTPGAGTPAVGVPLTGTPALGTPIAGAGDGLFLTQPADLLDQLPHGAAGQVNVVGAYPIDVTEDGDMRSVVLVRNETDQQVANISVTGAVRALDGSLRAAGSSEATWPAVVEPGGVAHAYVEFSGQAFEGTIAEFAVSWGPVPTYLSDIALTVVEANFVDRTLIGFVRNDATQDATGSQVVMSCWDPTGRMTTWGFTELDQFSLAPGQSASFELPRLSFDCPNLVVTAGG